MASGLSSLLSSNLRTAGCHGFWLSPPLMELRHTLFFRVSFGWVLKSSNTSGCLATRSPVTGYLATLLISCSRARFDSFTLHLQLRAGQRLIGWDLKAPGEWSGHSYLIRHILPPRSAPFICSGVARTSVSRKQLMTAHGSAITFDSGLWIPCSPTRHGLKVYGVHCVGQAINTAAEATAHALPSVAGPVKWIVMAALSGGVGLSIGAVSIPVIGFVFAPT